VLPQVAQGALAVECRADDLELQALLARIQHAGTRRCVDAERAFLTELGGDCSLPAAAYATIDGDELSIEGRIASVDGGTVLRHAASGPARASLGAEVARHLLDDLGGRELLGR
jgi:hydroxymethylbilane synthase